MPRTQKYFKETSKSMAETTIGGLYHGLHYKTIGGLYYGLHYKTNYALEFEGA